MGKEAVLSTLGKLGNLKVLGESLRGDAPEVGQIVQAVVVRYFFLLWRSDSQLTLSPSLHWRKLWMCKAILKK